MTSKRVDRPPLTTDRVVRAAMDIADRSGIAAVTMRSVATELGVQPMSIYHHVANKDAILDGITDLVFAEIGLPEPDEPWRDAMRRRALSARAVFVRHRWATALVSSRTNPGPATMRHHDAVIGNLRAGGFSVAMTAHAFALLDAHVPGYGGQGVTTDWPWAATAVAALAPMPVWLAGGITPDNVAAAIATVRPAGIDVASGAEDGVPGVKSRAKIAALVQACHG